MPLVILLVISIALIVVPYSCRNNPARSNARYEIESGLTVYWTNDLDIVSGCANFHDVDDGRMIILCDEYKVWDRAKSERK